MGAVSLVRHNSIDRTRWKIFLNVVGNSRKMRGGLVSQLIPTATAIPDPQSGIQHSSRVRHFFGFDPFVELLRGKQAEFDR
jgi:hypothetical protein